MAKHGRKYNEAFEKIDRDNKYTPLEAVTMERNFPMSNLTRQWSFMYGWE